MVGGNRCRVVEEDPMAGTIRTKALALGGGALAGALLLGGVAFAQVPGAPTPALAPTEQAAPPATPAPGAPGTKEDCPEDGARGARTPGDGTGTATPGTSGFSRARAPQA
jgi:hypothetical protein